MGCKTIREYYDIPKKIMVYKDNKGNIQIYGRDKGLLTISPQGALNIIWDLDINEKAPLWIEALILDEEKGFLQVQYNTVDNPSTFLKKAHKVNKIFTTKHYCEEVGYPNTTYLGELMNDTLFYDTRFKAYEKMKRMAWTELSKTLWGDQDGTMKAASIYLSLITIGRLSIILKDILDA